MRETLIRGFLDALISVIYFLFLYLIVKVLQVINPFKLISFNFYDVLFLLFSLLLGFAKGIFKKKFFLRLLLTVLIYITFISYIFVNKNLAIGEVVLKGYVVNYDFSFFVSLLVILLMGLMGIDMLLTFKNIQ